MNIKKIPFIPERTSRPRNHGVTMVMDKGLGLKETELIIEGKLKFVEIEKIIIETSMET